MKNKKDNQFKKVLIYLCCIFGGGVGFNLLNIESITLFGGNKSTITEEATTEMVTEVQNTAVPTTEAIVTQVVSPEVSPVVVKVETPYQYEAATENIKEKSSHVVSITSDDKKSKVAKAITESDEEMEEGVVEDIVSDELQESTENAEQENFIENDDVQAMGVTCKVKVESSGQLIFMSKEEIDEKGRVCVTYSVNDSETEDSMEENTTECELTDIINTDTSSDDETVKYLDVLPGIYIFNFINCDLKDVDVYLTDNIEELVVDELQDESEEELIGECTIVPFQDTMKVSILETNQSYKISILPEYDFVPIIQFYSENGIAGMLRILDEFGDELEIIELSESEEENVQEIEGSFMFEKGVQYYIEITSFSQNEDLSEYIYYFQISDYFQISETSDDEQL